MASLPRKFCFLSRKWRLILLLRRIGNGKRRCFIIFASKKRISRFIIRFIELKMNEKMRVGPNGVPKTGPDRDRRTLDERMAKRDAEIKIQHVLKIKNKAICKSTQSLRQSNTRRHFQTCPSREKTSGKFDLVNEFTLRSKYWRYLPCLTFDEARYKKIGDEA